MKPKPEIKRYRRYVGFDYSSGAWPFITIAIEPRRPLLAQIEAGRSVPTELGRIVERELLETPRHAVGVRLVKHCIMPDHIHFLVHLASGLPSPLKALGRFVVGFKRVVAHETAGRVKWQQGYHDRICNGRIFREHVMRYIAYNPLKWELMHGREGFCRVIEPIESPLLDDADYWRGVGNLALLDGARRFCAVRISRRVAESRFAAICARIDRGLAMGYTIVSTFLSPGERALYRHLTERGAAFVVVKERALPLVYRPDIAETPLLAEGRLAILGNGSVSLEEDKITRSGCLALNDKIATLARASGGFALYIRE